MNLQRAEEILKNITDIAGGNLGTNYIAGISNNIHQDFFNKIICSIIAGGLAVDIIAGYQVRKPDKNTINLLMAIESALMGSGFSKIIYFKKISELRTVFYT